MKQSNRTAAEFALHGVVAACLSPRRAGEPNVDLASLLEMVDFLCTAHVDGIVLFGSTGEFVQFETADRARALSLAVRRSRCPVYANVSHAHLDAALALTDEAANAGAAGVLLMPPIYFRYDQETVRQYCLDFLKSAGGLLPAYLYNIPQFATPIAIETAVELLGAGFAGIKDSSGDVEYFQRLLDACGSSGASLVTGGELLYGRFRNEGAAGVVSGIASAVPELVVAYDRFLCAADEDRVSRLRAWIAEFIAWFEEFPTPMIIREAAKLRGLSAGDPAAPLGPALTARLDEFRAWFPAWWRSVHAAL